MSTGGLAQPDVSPCSPIRIIPGHTESPKYTRGVNRLADLLAMERGDPLEGAVWLLEHVSKTKGAQHLKLASRNLNIFQYVCLDVLVFFMMVMLIAFKVIAMRCQGHQRLFREKIKYE